VNLRKEARGRDCQVRLPVCNGNPETVVLAHFRQIGISGIGHKGPDFIGAWACSDCHSAIDRNGGNIPGMDIDQILLAHARAVFRTQYILWKEGKIK
jgi:hypothetical protein